jgi:hypothetical protein
MARQREDLRAFRVAGADSGVRLGPVCDDPRDVGERFDVVYAGRPVPQSRCRGKGRTWPRHSSASFNRRDERGLLAAHERASTLPYRDRVGESRPHDVLAEKPACFRIGDRLAQPFDRERVLGAHIHVALASSDRVGGEGHALQYRVRVPLKHGPVHEGPGVTLVGVAAQVLEVTFCRTRELPLHPCREARTPATAQPGVADHLDDLLGGHRRERRGERYVVARGKRAVQALRVDDAAIAQDYPLLSGVERDVRVACDRIGAR